MQNHGFFKQAGGEKLEYIPALNDSEAHAGVMKALVMDSISVIPLEQMPQFRQVFFQRTGVEHHHFITLFDHSLVQQRRYGGDTGCALRANPPVPLSFQVRDSVRSISSSSTAIAKPPLSRMIWSTLKWPTPPGTFSP